MLLRTNKRELNNLIQLFFGHNAESIAVSTIQHKMFFESSFVFKKRTKVGEIYLKLDIYPLHNGDLEIDIADAKIAGMGVFGVVRKKAGELIVSNMTAHVPCVKTWKNSKGNIQIQIPGVFVKRFIISGDEVLIELVV